MEFEVPGMDEVKKGESHMSSAAAFVEGGNQEACDDACSICLEAFCDSNPSTVTSCMHEFHLQCILEWCQRSSNCPMCWQLISLKDPSSQELLDAVQQERSFRFTPLRNATIFHHPAFGDFELQHLPVGVSDPELEERIIQHLAAAVAMGRTHRIARMEGSRSRSSAHARPQFVVISAHPNASSTGTVPASLAASEAENEPTATIEITPSVLPTSTQNEDMLYISSSSQNNQVPASSSESLAMASTRLGISNDNRSYVNQSSLPNQDRAGPSELQSFSNSWKSRLNAMSMKYKESISKSTRGWKEKFSRSSSMADIGSEVKREVNSRIATVSRMMERLEPRDKNRDGRAPLANNIVESSDTELSHHENRDVPNEPPSNEINSASSASGSSSSSS